MRQLLSTLAILASVLLLGCTYTDPQAPDTRPPNILLLVAEDLSPRIGAWGDAVAQTPNLDALAERGVRYTHAYTAAGVCAPSRASLIMGQHAISFGAGHMRTTTGPLGRYLARPDAEAKAFPELLRRAGYYTFTDGKLDYQFSGITAGTGPASIWDAEGFDAHWRNRDPGQPFFGLINFMETHESGVMTLDGPVHSQAHAQTRAFRRSLGLAAEAVTDPADVAVPPIYPDTPEVRADLARHYDNIAAMDARVGRLLEELAEDGLAANTIVIWTTDHGDGLPRAKRELYDTGIRVPMIIAKPSAASGIEASVVSFVDLAPTVLRYAGLAEPDWLHGQAVQDSNRRYAFAARDRHDEVMDRQRAVTDGRYKLIRSDFPELAGGHPLAYRDNLESVRAMRALFEPGELTAEQARWFEPVGEERLFDTDADPWELTDLSQNPDYKHVLRRLGKALDAHLTRVGDTGLLDERDLKEQLAPAGEVPTTPTPTLSVNNQVLIASAQDNASIVWRLPGGRWRLVTAPLPAEPGMEFKAVRYGWEESSVVRYTPTDLDRRPVIR